MITMVEIDRIAATGGAWGIDPQPENIVSLDEDEASVVDERVCIRSGCSYPVRSFTGLLHHLRVAHPEERPNLDRCRPDIEILDRHYNSVTWSEIEAIIDHPHFWRAPEGIVYTDASID